MSLQTCSLIVFVFLAQMAAGTGVQFVMERHPDNYFCGHLQCLADFTHTDHDVSSFAEMTIYDITRVNSELRLASVSTFDPDLYVDTTKSSAMCCTGTISRLEANLTLQLRHDIDCLYGVYKCQLDLVTVSGHSEVLTEIITPEYNHSYSRIAEVLSHFDRLTEMLNSFTVLMNNQTAQINRLAIYSDDQTAQIKRLTSQSDDQTVQIEILTSQSDKQIAQIVNQITQLNRLSSQSDDQTAHLNRLSSQADDQTAQIKRFTSQSDKQTAHLVNQTTQLNRLLSQSDDQTTQLNRLARQSDVQAAQIKRLSSQSDKKTAQLVDQTATLHNISQRCDLDQADRKQRHEQTENRLKLLQEKLDKVEELLNPSIEPVPDLRACRRGQLRRNDRQRIVLWGNITSVCDTTTDGGGWVIIQRRERGDVDFYRGWDDYKKGFGSPDTDLWIGNDIIHNLTSQGYNELRIDFVHNGANYFAQYTNFSVADESSDYRLNISGYSGNVYDSMDYHNGSSFSTPDRDNDYWSGNSCSVVNHGSWWYNACSNANLNGVWAETDLTGIAWHFAPYESRSPLTFTEMKIR